MLENGLVVYACVDYARILGAAEEKAEGIVWDGGNNDTPFFLPSLHIVVCDLVLLATPMRLSGLLSLDKPSLRVRYEYQDHPIGPTLEDALRQSLELEAQP